MGFIENLLEWMYADYYYFLLRAFNLSAILYMYETLQGILRGHHTRHWVALSTMLLVLHIQHQIHCLGNREYNILGSSRRFSRIRGLLMLPFASPCRLAVTSA